MIKQEHVRQFLKDGTTIPNDTSGQYMLHLGRRDSHRKVRVRMLEIQIDS